MLTNKQKDFINNSNHRFNIKIGATRSGKTYLDIMYTIPSRIRERTGKEGLYVILGVSKGTIERNVLEPLRERFGSDLVGIISSNNTTKLFGEQVYCLGAEKVNQVSKIRGASIKYCYCDELAEYNEEVWELLKSRLDKPYSCLDATLNPESNSHWLKKNFLDTVEEKDIDAYIQYYTLFDNDYLSEEFINNLCKEYEGTVFYNRYILGQWCNAEGIIYRQFADNPNIFIKDDAIDENGNKINFMIITIGIDYGANQSTTRFICNGITPYFKEVWALDEMKIEGIYSPDILYEKFKEFYHTIVNEYGKVTHAFGDYGALGEILTFGLNRNLQQSNIPLQVQDCVKGRIVDRIELDCQLFGQKKRHILKKCKGLIEAYSEALWNDKVPDERLDDGTTDIDSLDANEYSYFSFYDKFMTTIQRI